MTNTDNDAAGITVTPTAGLMTTEAGGHGDVHGGAHHAADGGRDDRAELERHDRRHGRAGEPDLYDRQLERGADGDGDRRRRRRWSTGRSRVHDRDGAGGEHATPNYTGANAADVAVTNTDNDAAGITVTPTAGLATTEAGGTATFTVVLNTQPTADVTIALSSSDTTEGHGRAGEPDLHDRQLERGADGDGDRRRRRRWSTAPSRTRS